MALRIVLGWALNTFAASLRVTVIIVLFLLTLAEIGLNVNEIFLIFLLTL
jgi:hypothetical protein